MRDIRSRMARKHERHLANELGLRLTRGSGNQPNDQTDGRHSYGGVDQSFGCAVEAKSSLAGSFSVTRATWRKLVEQAHWARPVLAVRLYEDESLGRALDLAVLGLDDFAELLDAADRTDRVRALLRSIGEGDVQYADRDGESATERLAADVADVLAGRRPTRADLPAGYEQVV